MAYRKNVPLASRKEIWSLPCCICGSHNNVCVDHIIPVSKGGTNERSNLQSLCKRCNDIKGNRLTNEELKERYLLRKAL